MLRDVYLCEKKGKLERYYEKKAIWNSLSKEYQEDLKRFLSYDDFGKGFNTNQTEEIKNKKI